MFTFIIIGLVALLTVLEVISLRRACTRLRFTCTLDMNLCEPDETVTMRYTISNVSILPVMFAGVSIFFPDGLVIHEDPAWMERNINKLISGHNVSIRTSLRPRASYSGAIHFSSSARGMYTIGRHFIEGGDFLGLKDRVISLPPTGTLVCTARRFDDEADTNALGSMTGDISVRRFIHDDPTLILGYGEYTGLEPMKSISWTQTAKTGKLMVRRNDFTTDVNVTILFNMCACTQKQAETCLSMLRTVCETLEDNRIPYSMISNGDLRSTAQGMGRGHLYDVLYRIGSSVFASFTPFEDIVCQITRDNIHTSGYVLITPYSNDSVSDLVNELEMHSGSRAIVMEAR